MNENEYGVLLAVGADGVRDGALDFAAAEATRRGTGVELVHVVHSLVVTPDEVSQQQSIDLAVNKVGRTVLTDAAGRMRERVGDRVPVSSQLLSGPVAATITDRAAGAEMVVLERRDTGLVERLLTMSISTKVAAHAHAPVAVIPRGWRPPTGELPVTVGVDRIPDADSQVSAAATYARSVASRLVVLHAVWMAEPYQDLAFMDQTRNELVGSATRELEKCLADSGYPRGDDLACEVRWASPADALVDATRRSRVLVLSRRAPSSSHGVHLGPLTRAVLQHAAGPVILFDRT